jgi:hypothetical protein
MRKFQLWLALFQSFICSTLCLNFKEICDNINNSKNKEANCKCDVESGGLFAISIDENLVYKCQRNDSRKKAITMRIQDYNIEFGSRQQVTTIFCDQNEVDKNVLELLPFLNKTISEKSNETLKFMKCPLPDRFSTFSSRFPNVKKVKFADLDSENISSNFFDQEVELIEFSSVRCKLKTIPENLFQKLKFLVTIDMFFEFLENLPPKLFSHNLLLQKITLYGLRLELPEKIFSNNINLKILNLGRNNFKNNLGATIFRNNINLENLDLNNNKIEFLDRYDFNV